MLTFLPNADVTIQVGTVNAAGQAAIGTSVSYRVVDENDVEIVASTTATITTGQTSVNITVPAASNTVPVGQLRSLRVIQVYFTTASGKSLSKESYVLTNDDLLVTGVNSFQTYSKSLLTSFEMPNLSNWELSTDQIARSRAMILAYERICRLTFNDRMLGGSSDVLAADGYLRGREAIRVGDLREYTESDLSNLWPKFYLALQRAQIVEADAILGGETVESARDMGVISKKVGDASETYSDSKPVRSFVSRRTLEELAGYVVYSTRLARG